jgi:predicted RNase H-like HicB family nuclease
VEIIFEVTEDPVDGGFVAAALGHGLTTEADTLTDLREMVKDAVQCHFHDVEQMPKIIPPSFRQWRSAVAMKLPRDLSANQLIKALKVLGYSMDHQRGSHIRIVA